MKIATRIASAILLIAISGCSGVPDHPFWIREDLREQVYSGRLLLAPINALNQLPRELLPGAARVQAILDRYLASSPNEVVGTVPEGSFRTLSHIAEFEFGSRQADTLVDRLEEDYEFDALLVPTIVIQAVAIESGMLRFDGVWRTSGLPPGQTFGKTAAASLSVHVYDRSGALLFHGLGGLDMLFRANSAKQKMELIDHPLSNADHLREGVGLALHPLIPIAR